MNQELFDRTAPKWNCVDFPDGMHYMGVHKCQWCGKTDEQIKAGEKQVTDNVLTINQAGYLADLIRGVERGAKLRYYPMGAKDADHPMTQVLRAFTHDGGGFWPNDQDIRDGYVWTSGISERWFKVSDLIKAMANLDGRHGINEPIAIIDFE